MVVEDMVPEGKEFLLDGLRALTLVYLLLNLDRPTVYQQALGRELLIKVNDLLPVSLNAFKLSGY